MWAICRTRAINVLCVLMACANLAMNGATAVAQFPNDYKFGDDTTGTDFTIAGWFNASVSQTTDVGFISNKDWGSGGNTGYVLTINSDETWKTNVNGVLGPRADTTWTSFNLNEWNFIAATFDRDGNVTAYLNGGNSSTATMPNGSVDTWEAPFFYDFNIGQDGTGDYNGGQGFNGLTDEVGIWRRALDATEIANLYTEATANGNSLGALGSTSLNGSNPINQDLVGYYAFDGNLNDAAGTPQNGTAKSTGDMPGTVAYGTGLFGQALQTDGSNYVTIGEAVPPADATFTGNSASDNNASNAGNWDLDPAALSPNQGIIVADGTSETFNGANSGPAVFDGSFPATEVKNYVFGGNGVTTYIDFVDAPGDGSAQIIQTGASDSVIGVAGSTVSLSMSGSSILEHRGADEEGSELQIGREGATVNVVLNDAAELTAGPRVADPSYATGFRRPISTDPPGTAPRTGDDIKLGEGNGDDGTFLTTVNLTMNGDSVMYSPDVFYPGDSNNNVINVVQNGNSQVIAGWDTRFLDDGHEAGEGVNWTMNGNSKFLAARDHGLAETAGEGFVNLTINDNAEFFAGDRIVLGAGSTDTVDPNPTVTVTLNSGLIKVGGDSPSDVLYVDPTGDPTLDDPPSDPPRAIDWILHMGGGSKATLNVLGGKVEVGRSAYIGRGGGTANLLVDGGTFEIKGVGPTGVGLGNAPGGGVPGGVEWSSNGGDVILGYDQNDQGTFEYRSGTVDIARDLILSFDADFDEVGGNGTLILGPNPSPLEEDSFTVGADLGFSGDFFAASGEAEANLEVVLDGSNVVPITVGGDLYIYNDGTSISNFSAEVALGGAPPALGEYVIIDYAGSRLGSGTQMFTELASSTLTYNLIYDDVMKQVRLNITDVMVSLGCDFNGDDVCNAADINSLMSEIASGDNNASFDLTGDGLVNNDDRDAWLQQAGTVNIGAAYLLGDANLDGSVDVSDFNSWNEAKFTDNTNWTAGNFNGDSGVDVSDFNAWNTNKFQMSGGGVNVVPEPGSLALLALATLLLNPLFRRRSVATKQLDGQL